MALRSKPSRWGPAERGPIATTLWARTRCDEATTVCRQSHANPMFMGPRQPNSTGILRGAGVRGVAGVGLTWEPKPTVVARPVKVLVVEDDEWLRDAVQHAIEWPNTGLVQVGSAASAVEAVDLLNGGLEPDVALVDLGLLEGSGLDVIRALRVARPQTASIVFTVRDEPAVILEAIRAGAQGYLLKSATIEVVLRGLLEAHEGGSPMTPSVARYVIDALRDQHRDGEPVRVADPPLTRRETEVLQFLAKGMTYAETARLLGIGLGTVQGYVKRIYEKLHVDSKAEAATVAQRMGLV